MNHNNMISLTLNVKIVALATLMFGVALGERIVSNGAHIRNEKFRRIYEDLVRQGNNLLEMGDRRKFYIKWKSNGCEYIGYRRPMYKCPDSSCDEYENEFHRLDSKAAICFGNLKGGTRCYRRYTDHKLDVKYTQVLSFIRHAGDRQWKGPLLAETSFFLSEYQRMYHENPNGKWRLASKNRPRRSCGKSDEEARKKREEARKKLAEIRRRKADRKHPCPKAPKTLGNPNPTDLDLEYPEQNEIWQEMNIKTDPNDDGRDRIQSIDSDIDSYSEPISTPRRKRHKPRFVGRLQDMEEERIRNQRRESAIKRHTPSPNSDRKRKDTHNSPHDNGPDHYSSNKIPKTDDTLDNQHSRNVRNRQRTRKQTLKETAEQQDPNYIERKFKKGAFVEGLPMPGNSYKRGEIVSSLKRGVRGLKGYFIHFKEVTPDMEYSATKFVLVGSKDCENCGFVLGQDWESNGIVRNMGRTDCYRCHTSLRDAVVSPGEGIKIDTTIYQKKQFILPSKDPRFQKGSVAYMKGQDGKWYPGKITDTKDMYTFVFDHNKKTDRTYFWLCTECNRAPKRGQIHGQICKQNGFPNYCRGYLVENTEKIKTHDEILFLEAENALKSAYKTDNINSARLKRKSVPIIVQHSSDSKRKRKEATIKPPATRVNLIRSSSYSSKRSRKRNNPIPSPPTVKVPKKKADVHVPRRGSLTPRHSPAPLTIVPEMPSHTPSPATTPTRDVWNPPATTPKPEHIPTANLRASTSNRKFQKGDLIKICGFTGKNASVNGTTGLVLDWIANYNGNRGPRWKVQLSGDLDVDSYFSEDHVKKFDFHKESIPQDLNLLLVGTEWIKGNSGKGHYRFEYQETSGSSK